MNALSVVFIHWLRALAEPRARGGQGADRDQEWRNVARCAFWLLPGSPMSSRTSAPMATKRCSTLAALSVFLANASNALSRRSDADFFYIGGKKSGQ